MAEQKKQKMQFLVILTIVFLAFIGISMPYLIFPALFLNPSYSILPVGEGASNQALFLGITLAAYPLGQFIGSPILGALSDDYGRKPLLSGSLAISALCNLLTGFAIEQHYLGLLIISRFTAGLMEGNIAIARAMAADITTISKHETFGKINATASIAFLVGPLLGALMADKSLWESLTTATPFYSIAILFFCLSLLSLLLLEKTVIRTPTKVQTFWQRIHLIKRMSVLFSNKHLQFLMIISTCFTLAVDIFYEFGPVHLTIQWALAPVQLIIYNGVLCLGLAAGNGWLPTLLSKHISNRLAILSSIGGFTLCLIGVVLTKSTFLMITLFGLSGLAIGLAVTLLTVNISNSIPDTIQGEVMGTQVSLRVLGDAIICLFGGTLLLLSSKLILIAAAIMCACATIYYGRAKTA
ncbi:MAG: MFS transporter [Simkania sp.]|nr:MFS transporter [Simkania sp.]